MLLISPPPISYEVRKWRYCPRKMSLPFSSHNGELNFRYFIWVIVRERVYWSLTYYEKSNSSDSFLPVKRNEIIYIEDDCYMQGFGKKARYPILPWVPWFIRFFHTYLFRTSKGFESIIWSGMLWLLWGYMPSVWHHI